MPFLPGSVVTEEDYRLLCRYAGLVERQLSVVVEQLPTRRIKPSAERLENLYIAATNALSNAEALGGLIKPP